MNKVILCGNLGKNIELRYTASGKAVASFPLATSKKRNGKNGELQEYTEWHNIVVWGTIAEVCAKYLEKGKKVLLEGELQTRSYEGKDGDKRYITEVVAQGIELISPPPANGVPPKKPDPEPVVPDDLDGIPF